MKWTKHVSALRVYCVWKRHEKLSLTTQGCVLKIHNKWVSTDFFQDDSRTNRRGTNLISVTSEYLKNKTTEALYRICYLSLIKFIPDCYRFIPNWLKMGPSNCNGYKGLLTVPRYTKSKLPSYGHSFNYSLLS